MKIFFTIFMLGIVCFAEDIQITHGIASGQITSNSACIWARAEKESIMNVIVFSCAESQKEMPKKLFVKVNKQHDFCGKIYVSNLKANTKYKYYVFFTEDYISPLKENIKNILEGEFSTAPEIYSEKETFFAWGGDVGGQNVGRDIEKGFPAFAELKKMPLDFFIGLGDMIYADNTIDKLGFYGNAQIKGPQQPATDLSGFWEHWQYNRADKNFQTLLKTVPYFGIWDDHEVVNDFGPLHDTRETKPYHSGSHLMPLGLASFLDYNPFLLNEETPLRLYHTVRWGKHLEIFFLDTRQYRDANIRKDDALNPKTMLGREQLVWFKDKLQKSNATWKVIVSSVPISIPTGYPPENGRDGWANFDQETGFENELQDIFHFMKKNNIQNNIWITTDVHFATAFCYSPFDDAKDFNIYEFVTGPMNAGLFPNKNYDKTFSPEKLFFFGPEDFQKLSYNEAITYMNFGSMHIDLQGNVTIKIHNALGKIIYEHKLQPKNP